MELIIDELIKFVNTYISIINIIFFVIITGILLTISQQQKEIIEQNKKDL